MAFFKDKNTDKQSLFNHYKLNTNTSRNYRGRWVYFDKTSKDLKDHSFENWVDLTF